MCPKQKSVSKIKKKILKILRYRKEKNAGYNKQSHGNKYLKNEKIGGCIAPYIDEMSIFI